MTLGGHEIGTTRVTVMALDHARFDIEVTTDPLLEKLETVAGETASGTTNPAALQERLDALDFDLLAARHRLVRRGARATRSEVDGEHARHDRRRGDSDPEVDW